MLSQVLKGVIYYKYSQYTCNLANSVIFGFLARYPTFIKVQKLADIQQICGCRFIAQGTSKFRVVILSQRTNTQKMHKVSHFQSKKNLYQKTELYEI